MLKEKYDRFNDYVSIQLSNLLANMTVFWVMLVITTLPVIIQPPTTLSGWLGYLSSAIFQAVALVVLTNSTDKQTQQILSLLKSTHDTVITELQYVKDSLQLEKEEHDELKANFIIVVHKLTEIDAKLDKALKGGDLNENTKNN